MFRNRNLLIRNGKTLLNTGKHKFFEVTRIKMEMKKRDKLANNVSPQTVYHYNDGRCTLDGYSP